MPCWNWWVRISTSKTVPSLRRWRVSKVTVSPAPTRCASRSMAASSRPTSKSRVHPDQFFPAVAQALAGLAVDVEHGQVIVMQEKSVRRVVHERAEAGFARPQLVLCSPQLGDVLHHAEHVPRSPRFIPRHLAPAVHDPHLAARADHPVFHVVARPALQRRRRRLADALPVLGVDQGLPLRVPAAQIDAPCLQR